MSIRTEIINGPSREELFDGLRLFNEKRLIPLLFKKHEKEKYSAVIINSIEAEDGSGDSWNITFYINNNHLTDSFFSKPSEKPEHGVYAKKINFDGFRELVKGNYLVGEYRKDTVLVKAYYSTKTRRGVL
jgi:hypothetical protein